VVQGDGKLEDALVEGATGAIFGDPGFFQGVVAGVVLTQVEQPQTLPHQLVRGLSAAGEIGGRSEMALDQGGQFLHEAALRPHIVAARLPRRRQRRRIDMRTKGGDGRAARPFARLMHGGNPALIGPQLDDGQGRDIGQPGGQLRRRGNGQRPAAQLLDDILDAETEEQVGGIDEDGGAGIGHGGSAGERDWESMVACTIQHWRRGGSGWDADVRVRVFAWRMLDARYLLRKA